MDQNELIRAVSLLRSLLYDGSRIAFTGRSLDVLLAHLEGELGEEPEEHEALLNHWQDNLSPFRERLLATALESGSTVSLKGEVVPLISENVTVTALLGCPPRPKFPTPSLAPALGKGQ